MLLNYIISRNQLGYEKSLQSKQAVFYVDQAINSIEP